MSEPERWMIGWTAKVCIPDGEWIKYEDYAKLKAEHDRLIYHADAMARALEGNGFNGAVKLWNDAKGMQS
jgi:hypothetical protein